MSLYIKNIHINQKLSIIIKKNPYLPKNISFNEIYYFIKK